jgi:uncharacterized membrane protein
VDEWGTLLLQVAAGVSLAACAGLRAFLPLLVVGISGRMGWLTLSDRFEWLSSWPALVIFGVAVVTEIVSDKFPVIDHLLDVLQSFVKPVAGALLVAAVVRDLTPLQTTVLGILGGGGTAAVVHVAKAKVRLLSSAVTAGLGNPILSLGEDVVTAAGSILAILAPFLVLLFFGVAIALLWLLFRRFQLRSARFENR